MWPQRLPNMGNISADDPKVRRETVNCTTKVLKRELYLCNIMERFSSWYHAKKIKAWVLRYRKKLLQASLKRKEAKSSQFMSTIPSSE